MDVLEVGKAVLAAREVHPTGHTMGDQILRGRAIFEALAPESQSLAESVYHDQGRGTMEMTLGDGYYWALRWAKERMSRDARENLTVPLGQDFMPAYRDALKQRERECLASAVHTIAKETR